MTHVPPAPPRGAEENPPPTPLGSGTAAHFARTAGTIAIAFVAYLAADAVSSYLFFAAAFGSPAILLWIIAVAAVTVVVLILAVTLVTGSRRIVGPIVATVVTALVGGLAVLTGELTPMIGEPATPAAHLLICAGGALVLGVFLGPWPFRVIGGMAAVSLVAYAGLIAPPLPEDTRQSASGNRDEIEASFESFLDDGTRPLITDDPEWEVAFLDASGGPATSVIVSPVGGATTVVVDNTPLSGTWDADAFACWQLTDRFSIPDTETNYEDWSDVCTITLDGWEASDATAFGWVENGTLIFTVATGPNEFTAVPEAMPASVAEMSELRGMLRPMTKDEMREAFADHFLGPQ